MANEKPKVRKVSDLGLPKIHKKVVEQVKQEEKKETYSRIQLFKEKSPTEKKQNIKWSCIR